MAKQGCDNAFFTESQQRETLGTGRSMHDGRGISVQGRNCLQERWRVDRVLGRGEVPSGQGERLKAI